MGAPQAEPQARKARYVLPALRQRRGNFNVTIGLDGAETWSVCARCGKSDI